MVRSTRSPKVRHNPGCEKSAQLVEEVQGVNGLRSGIPEGEPKSEKEHDPMLPIAMAP